MSNKINFISDHAVLRWAERVLGLDVEGIRQEIADTPGLIEAANLGATRFSADGVVFLMSRHSANAPMIVTTVIDGDSPSHVRHSHQKRNGRLGTRQGNKTKSSSYDARMRRVTLATEYEDEMAG